MRTYHIEAHTKHVEVVDNTGVSYGIFRRSQQALEYIRYLETNLFTKFIKSKAYHILAVICVSGVLFSFANLLVKFLGE